MKQILRQELPAGLIGEGVEIFAHQHELCALFHGQKIAFLELPEKILNVFRAEMIRNTKAMKNMIRLGKEGDELLLQYCWCNYGGFNVAPDYEEGELIPEYWDCGSRGKCPYEGTICMSFIEKDFILSKREVEIVRLIANGLCDKQIADALDISYYTVTVHRRNIEHKLKARSKVDVAVFAIHNDII